MLQIPLCGVRWNVEGHCTLYNVMKTHHSQSGMRLKFVLSLLSGMIIIGLCVAAHLRPHPEKPEKNQSTTTSAALEAAPEAEQQTGAIAVVEKGATFQMAPASMNRPPVVPEADLLKFINKQ